MSGREVYHEIKKSFTSSTEPCFEIRNVNDDWALPNKGNFGSWVDKQFKYPKKQNVGDQTCGNSRSLHLKEHQHFVKDYLQYSSPYRGLLLYHGLGSGKSCSSVAAAEILHRHGMKVLVMLPASLRTNYATEVKTCGAKIFSQHQHWVFKKLETFKRFLQKVSDHTQVSTETIKKNDGIWIPDPTKEANYRTLDTRDQNAVNLQISDIVDQRYEFLHYNGITEKKLRDMWGDTNPCDNKCVVIDEVHHLISFIANETKLGIPLYNMLLQAKNCKIILLSGTPIINKAFEIAFIINIITGQKKEYRIPLEHTEFDKSLLSADTVDTFEIDYTSKTLHMTLYPSGFARLAAPNLVRRRRDDDEDGRISRLLLTLKDAGVPIKEKSTHTVTLGKTLPDDEEEFEEFFVDVDQNVIKNPNLFMSRIAGCVSYYKSQDADIYPTVIYEDIVKLPMTDTQYVRYLEVRKKERASSKNKKKFGSKDKTDPSNESYRAFSRAMCNFVFPDEVPRPMPKKVGMLDQDDGQDESEGYVKKLYAAISKMEDGGYLDRENLSKYSPKFSSVINRSEKSKGPVLVYSQFRHGEGLRILSRAHHAHGWAELKISRSNDGQWELDMDDAALLTKNKFVVYPEDKEKAKVLLQLYNYRKGDSIGEGERILETLRRHGLDRSNASGKIVKTLMITASAAEGISLKGVRQVHLVEPYWNMIRHDQVVGRAARMYSHVDLPEEKRNVKVYRYCSTFTKEQLKNVTLGSLDKNLTTDEHIWEIARKKAEIINGFLELMQRGSVDCVFNGNADKCFAMPTNTKPDHVAYNFDIRKDTQDTQYKQQVRSTRWKGAIYKTAQGNFLVNVETREVYDHNAYVTTGKLVRLGLLSEDPKGVYIVDLGSSTSPL